MLISYLLKRYEDLEMEAEIDRICPSHASSQGFITVEDPYRSWIVAFFVGSSSTSNSRDEGDEGAGNCSESKAQWLWGMRLRECLAEWMILT